jgi:hypothetical protein
MRLENLGGAGTISLFDSDSIIKGATNGKDPADDPGEILQLVRSILILVILIGFFDVILQ